MDYILNIKAFKLDNILAFEDSFLDEEGEHQHDERVTSVPLQKPQRLGVRRVLKPNAPTSLHGGNIVKRQADLQTSFPQPFPL